MYLFNRGPGIVHHVGLHAQGRGPENVHVLFIMYRPMVGVIELLCSCIFMFCSSWRPISPPRGLMKVPYDMNHYLGIHMNRGVECFENVGGTLPIQA